SLALTGVADDRLPIILPQRERKLCWVAPSALSIPPSREAPTMPVPRVATILRDHVSLSTSCIDRLYLNGYVPKLQSSGQLCAFVCDHFGNRIASPAAFRPLRGGGCVLVLSPHRVCSLVKMPRGPS